MIAWRTCKTRYDPWDGTGALLHGGRWHSPGRAVIYAADSFAGSLLEVLVHAMRPRTLASAHHAVRLDIPDDVAETVTNADVPGWDQRDLAVPRLFGDRWLEQARSAALIVPALPSRPIGRIVVINPAHPSAAAIVRGDPFPVPWDERLY